MTDSGYTDVDVIVDGALDASETFTLGDPSGELAAWLDTLKADAEREGFTAEVYILEHEHELGEEECSCAQYVTDHHPAFVFGPDGAETGAVSLTVAVLTFTTFSALYIAGHVFVWLTRAVEGIGGTS